MASVSNGNTPLPEEVGKPPEGVVLPPKDIRAIVEKTAGYVARNGVVFEDRVREKERNNPKFSFLNANDAYAPFYQWRLDEIKEGRGTAVSAGRAGDPNASAEPEKTKGPEEPEEFHFSARMPIINAKDLEVVKLTALFVAKRGKSFMTALSQRETRNFQFDFLRPQHSLYHFFTRLIDQYTILLRAEGLDAATMEKKRIADLERNVQYKYHILERAKKRAEWVKFQEQQKQQKEEEEEQERIEYAQIDWHDFVVVETVLFTDADDQVDLPPPTSLNDLQSASLEQKAAMSLNPLRIEEAMPTEDEAPTYYNAYPTQFEPEPAPVPVIPTGPAYPPQGYAPQPMPTPNPIPVPPAFATPAALEEEQRIRERMEARDRAAAVQASAKAIPGQQPMRIRSDYVPRAQARRGNAPSAATALCPNCHLQIPVDELDQHMRIELLDPRWKEQRAKADSRSATTNLSTIDVVNNLKRLASQRSDVFDANAPGGPAGTMDPEEESRRKKMAFEAASGAGPDVVPPPPVGPAGGPPNPQSMNIEEQIRRIHERQAMTRK
ncbi:splicing factor 3a, subunit 1 [Aspergillus heteromorphus CBS 117.55]|uniref:Splicing factor 3a, subunit 1 n=1 Tax=Aspergillus heteromorphus CBS 117.55 TaxID=1448321 RepID=A0A317W6J6_9EURO|nr:splicing factor 3a, subunit 1 [Aspergillus heteromorphus CBS 117.55]PWY82246.1 splicing factor 3a, subunit 1 [Aspergillus heteromorphus CBS 117.55]